MLKSNNLLKNYTVNQQNIQMEFLFDIDVMIPVNDSVRLLNRFVEEFNLADL